MWRKGLTRNPFPNKPWFLRVSSKSLWKTLWEKEKLLVTSNFSFSHSVFNPIKELSAIFNKFKIVVCKLFQFGGVQDLSFGKGLKCRINSLPNDKIFNWSKLKAFADDKINVTEKMKFVLKMMENN